MQELLNIVILGGNSLGNTVPEASNLGSALTAVMGPLGGPRRLWGCLFPRAHSNSYQLQDNLSWTHGNTP